jgi:hypothetical protein
MLLAPTGFGVLLSDVNLVPLRSPGRIVHFCSLGHCMYVGIGATIQPAVATALEDLTEYTLPPPPQK